MKKLVEIRDLTFGYAERPILEHIHMDIYERDYVLVLGPNGGGKTTLLKLMMGILQPWKGSIRIAADADGCLGYVPQFSDFNKDFPITVFDTLMTGSVNAENYLRRYDRKCREKAEMVLARLDLEEVGQASVHDLSGGQLQRLLIARALVSEPAVLFLDEPMTSIDLASRVNLFDFLKDLNETTAIIVVTHDPTPFAQIYNHVACVNRNLFYHDRGKLDAHSLEQVYGCPVELLGHGIPHTFLHDH